MSNLLHLMTHRDGRLGGRASLWLGDTKLAAVEAHALTDHVLLGVSLQADDPAVALKLAAGPWLSVRVGIPGRLRELLAALVLRGVHHDRWDDADVVKVSIHHGSVWWSLLHPADTWSSSTPRWRSGSWSFADALLGERTVEQRELAVHEVDIPLTEGSYRWRVTMRETVIRRTRWRVEVIPTFEADCLEGQQIPMPGKGENPWDCGPDAMFGLSAQARTLDEAVATVVGSVLRQRLRHGGSLTYTKETAAA